MPPQYPPRTYISYFDGRTLEYVAIEGNESKLYTTELLCPQPLVMSRGRTGYPFPPPISREIQRWNHNQNTQPHDHYGPQGRGLFANNTPYYDHGSQGSLGSEISMVYDEQLQLFYPSQPVYNNSTYATNGAEGRVDPLFQQNQCNHNGDQQNQRQGLFARSRVQKASQVSDLVGHGVGKVHKDGSGSKGKQSTGNKSSSYIDSSSNPNVPPQVPVDPQKNPKAFQQRGSVVYTKELTEPPKPVSSPSSNELRPPGSKPINSVSLPVPGSPTRSLPIAGENKKQAQKSALNSPHLPLSPKNENAREKYEAYIPASGLPPNDGPEIPEKKAKEEEPRRS